MEESNKGQQTSSGEVTSMFESNRLPSWNNYSAVQRYRSVRRAIKRGHVDLFTGIVYPDRPFNNRSNSRGRRMNLLRRQIYEQYMRKVTI